MLKRYCLAFLFVSSLFVVSFANDFFISSVYVKNGNQENSYKIAVEATITMSNDQIEMLENGIPLSYTYTLIVEEHRGLGWLQGSNEQKNYGYTISYNALTRQYVVNSHLNDKYENFPTLSLALAYIAEPKNLNLKIVNRQPSREYRGGVRLKLDINELPTPLRIPAYLSQDWNLDTGWKYWRLD